MAYLRRFVYPVILISLILLSCSEKNQTGQGGAGNAPPEITSGAVYPEQSSANTPLVVRYSARDAEGDKIQYAFRWYVDNEPVQDGPLERLEQGRYRKGSAVFVEIMPSDAFSTGKTFKTQTITILNLPPVIESVQVAPADPHAGEVLEATPQGTDPDGDSIRYFYQWKVNGRAATEFQESNTFNTAGLRKKDMIFAVVKADDWEAEGEPIESDVVVLANSGPRITSSPPTNLGDIYTYQVTAADPDNDRLVYTLETAPSGMTISPGGLIRWEPPKAAAEKRELPVKIRVDDGDGGTAYQEYSLFLEMQ